MARSTLSTATATTTPLHLEHYCVHHAGIALCEVNNGMSMALIVQSLYIVILTCFVSTSRCGANVWTALILFMYAAISLRFTIVVCCNNSSESVAQDIQWCRTVRTVPGKDDVNSLSWIAHCQDATQALQLFAGTSGFLQLALVVGCTGFLYYRRYLRRVSVRLRGTCNLLSQIRHFLQRSRTRGTYVQNSGTIDIVRAHDVV